MLLCCNAYLYFFTYFPYSTGHLSVSQIYRSSDGKTLAENPLLVARFPAIRRITLSGLFSNNALCRTPYTGYWMVFHLFSSCLWLLNYCCLSLHDYRDTFPKMASLALNSLYLYRLTLAVISIVMIIYGLLSDARSLTSKR